MAKTECKVSRDEFRVQATPLAVSMRRRGESEDAGFVMADVKEFSTGSLGWYANGKVMLPLGPNGMLVSCQVGMNITLVGSKELPGFDASKAAA